jgi:hypothetical protein
LAVVGVLVGAGFVAVFVVVLVVVFVVGLGVVALAVVDTGAFVTCGFSVADRTSDGRSIVGAGAQGWRGELTWLGQPAQPSMLSYGQPAGSV